ncbi:MAG: FAD-dependent oxidoreductase, partial [Verrucomicrobiota bacterium]
KVAAGLVTPITGSRFSISQAFEDRLLYAKEFYWNAEESTGARFFYHLPITKLFRDESEASRWAGTDITEGSRLHHYAEPLAIEPGLLNDRYGGFQMKRGGWMNVPAFLEATRQHLLERAAYAIGKVNSEEVDTFPNAVRWRNIEAGKVIFAEGWQAGNNRFFDWLKMHNALGDILEVEIPALREVSQIVNRGPWLLPLGGGRFKAGSNYRHHLTGTSPDEEGEQEVAKKLQSITPQPYEIVGHQCAIRPIIKRSQVFCGIHPAFDSVTFFNGLGSKGVVNAPWYARSFVNHLEDGTPLPQKADIRENLIQ